MKVDKLAHKQASRHVKARKIAYLLTPVEFGGAERVSLGFLQNYQQNNSIILPIILCRPWETENLFLNELQRIGMDYFIVPTRRKPREQGKDIFRVVRSAMSIYTELRKRNVDLIHTNGYYADLTGLIAAKLLRVPIVTTCHGFIKNNIKYRLYNKLDVIAFRFIDKIIAVSDKIKADLVGQGIRKNKIQVVQNAVCVKYDDQEMLLHRVNTRKRYAIRTGEVVVGYIGRLSEEKGLKYLIDAVSALNKDAHSIRLMIIGDGPQYNEITRLIEKRALKEKIVLAGFQKDISAFLPALDIFVLPSLTEGTSMALLEAMAFGLPVIATAVGGTPMVVKSAKVGILVPPESSEAIADALQELVKNSSLRETLGKAASRTILSEFSILRWLEEIDNIYAKLY